jgi:hypothetical protein
MERSAIRVWVRISNSHWRNGSARSAAAISPHVFCASLGLYVWPSIAEGELIVGARRSPPPAKRRFLRIDPPPPTSRASFARLGPATGEGAWREGRSQCMASRSRRMFCARYSFISYPLQGEGAGNAGRSMRPIAACAMVVVERTRVSQVTPKSPGIPRAMVYGLYVLSPVIGLF